MATDTPWIEPCSDWTLVDDDVTEDVDTDRVTLLPLTDDIVLGISFNGDVLHSHMTVRYTSHDSQVYIT